MDSVVPTVLRDLWCVSHLTLAFSDKQRTLRSSRESPRSIASQKVRTSSFSVLHHKQLQAIDFDIRATRRRRSTRSGRGFLFLRVCTRSPAEIRFLKTLDLSYHLPARLRGRHLHQRSQADRHGLFQKIRISTFETLCRETASEHRNLRRR